MAALSVAITAAAGAADLAAARALVHALLREAAAAGYRQMVLDTLLSMKAAQALYRELGFEDVAASTSHPVEGARYMTRSLAAVNDATPGS